MTDSRVIPGQRRRRQGRGVEAPLPHEEEVLARAFGDAPVVVQRDPLVVPVRDRLHLDELAVRVVRRRLRHRGHRVRRDAHPGGAADVDALLEGVGAQVLAPFVAPDRDVDRVRERVDAEGAVAPVHEGPDVTGREAVRAHDLERRVAQRVDRVRDRHPVDLGRPEQAVEMVVEPEDRGAARRVVAALAFEDAGAVVQRMREHVNLRVREVHQLPVHPDLLDGFEAHRGLRESILSESVEDSGTRSARVDQPRQRDDHGRLEAEDAGAEREEKRRVFFE